MFLNITNQPKGGLLMKRFATVMVLMALLLLASCDPVYPVGKLKVTMPDAVTVGQTADIVLKYPNTGGSIVTGWKDVTVEIVSGKDVVAVSDMTVIGLQTGTVVLRVTVTTVISNEALASGHEEKQYETEFSLTVTE
jgi:hypothetical protein